MRSSPSARSCHPFAAALLLVLLLLPVGLPAESAAAEAGRYHFDSGVSHFRNDELRQALQAFERAREDGMDTPRLRFNLALTHYKLGDYARARALFRGLVDTSGFDAMAHYHLGLIAERDNDRQRAAQRYREALERSGPTSLRRLAEAGLERTRGVRQTSFYLFGGGGLDDNPALLNDINRGETESDSYLELFGHAAHRRGAGIFDGNVFLRRYNSAAFANTALLSGSAGRQTALAGGTLQYRAEITAIRIDDERLQEEYAGRLDWERPLGSARYLDARLTATRVQAAEDFDFLSGWRYRARLRGSGRLGSGWWRAGYQFELNDREDIAEDGDFFSRSPLRQRLRLEMGHPLPGAFSLESRLSYRHSRYRNKDRFGNEDGSTTEQRRTENRLAARIGTRWRLSQAWSTLIEYEYRDNRSSFDSFSYDRHTLLLGLEWRR